MNIAFFNHTLRVGSGIDTVIFELASRLTRRHNVTVFTLYSEYTEVPFTLRILETWIRNQFGITTLYPMLPSAFRACKELQTFDIINAHLYPSNVVASRVKGPVKVFVEWSTVDPARFSEYAHERLYARLLVSGNRYAARRADHLLVPSGFVKSWVEENFGLRSVQMLLDGINFDLFDRGRVTPSIVHENFPELKDGKMILFVGRIAPNKGIEQLVRSFAEVREVHKDAFLVIVGELTYPRYYATLKSLVRELHLNRHVIFTGLVSRQDLPAYYAAASVYASCSPWEGFLRAEPYAFAKPMVAFDCSSNAETIRNGETGYLASSGDTKQFASYVSMLLGDEALASQMGERGYEWARSHLDFEIIGKSVEDFFELTYKK